MQSGKDKIKEAGIQVVAVSYDSVDVLKKFSTSKKIEFPLLSDPGSKVIKQMGLLNTKGKEGTRHHLISHPMTIIVGADGNVLAKIPATVRKRHGVDQLLEAWGKLNQCP